MDLMLLILNGTFSSGTDRALTASNTDFGITDGNIIIVGSLNINGVGHKWGFYLEYS